MEVQGGGRWTGEKATNGALRFSVTLPQSDDVNHALPVGRTTVIFEPHIDEDSYLSMLHGRPQTVVISLGQLCEN